MKVETIEGTNMYRLFDHVTVGIQLKGSEAHAHVLSFSLLNNQPWKDGNGAHSASVNFLEEARMDQKSEDVEDLVDSNEEIETKKSKINTYQFFEDMRNIGVRPLT